MKIVKRKKTRTVEPSAFEADLNPEEFYQVDLSAIYKDTCVNVVYINRSVAFDVLDFVLESKSQNPVPEVGGFCLGKFHEEGPQNYNVSLDYFIASRNVADQSPVSLDFGPQALIELYEEQEQHPNLELIAWFHTHPGHSPFLSRQDLSIHNNYFKENYQLAIVLDSLTNDYETVFVSRKMDQSLNNQKSSKVWIPWKKTILNA